MAQLFSLDPNDPNYGMANGINQFTKVVAGFDSRQRGTSNENTYYIGQYFRREDGTVDYDVYYLYDALKTNWAASEYNNNWNDITCTDMRQADIAYESCTPFQQRNIDWVRGLALQVGCISIFCIDEAFWWCATISYEPPISVDYEVASVDFTGVPDTVNTYESAIIKEHPSPLKGASQSIDSILLNYA